MPLNMKNKYRFLLNKDSIANHLRIIAWGSEIDKIFYSPFRSRAEGQGRWYFIVRNKLVFLKPERVPRNFTKHQSIPSYSRTVSCELICRIVSRATATTIKSAVPEIFKTWTPVSL